MGRRMSCSDLWRAGASSWPFDHASCSCDLNKLRLRNVIYNRLLSFLGDCIRHVMLAGILTMTTTEREGVQYS